MSGKKIRQLELIGILFFVLGLLSILNLPILSSVGEQVKENSLSAANITTLDGTKYEGNDQFNSIQRSMLIGMLIGTVFFTLTCFLTGTCLLKQISHRSCIVGSVVILIAFPLGTALGIWALLTLFDNKTKPLFETPAELNEADFQP